MEYKDSDSVYFFKKDKKYYLFKNKNPRNRPKPEQNYYKNIYKLINRNYYTKISIPPAAESIKLLCF